MTESDPAASESVSTEWDQVRHHWERLHRADAAVNSASGLLIEIGCGLVLVGLGVPIVVMAFVVAWPILVPLTAVGLLALGWASHQFRRR